MLHLHTHIYSFFFINIYIILPDYQYIYILPILFKLVATERSERSGESSNPKRIHDDRVAFLEDTHLPITTITPTRPSSSNVFESGRLSICDRSPIRTLSEDRIHVSLRLGPLQSETESGETEDDSHLSDLPLLSKADGKRVMTKTISKKRTGNVAGQNTTVKRRRVTKTHDSPRRKLLMDAIGAGGRGKAKTSRTTRSTTAAPKVFPAMAKKGKDFRPPPPALP